MTLIHLNYRSKYLQGNTDVNVLLPELPGGAEPAAFYGSSEKYPVLWLLHGTTGDYSSWLRCSSVEEYASSRNMIIVMPSFQNTNYADWPVFANGFGAYSMLTEELMPLIYGWFPASTRREDNIIAGFSMGGRGACTYAYNHPEKFAAAYVMSGCPQDMRTHLNDRQFAMRNRNMVANAGGMEGFLNSPQNIWDMTAKVVKDGTDLPELIFACGDKDDVAYEDFCIFRTMAQEVGLKAEFIEEPGYGHEMAFWDRCVKDVLNRYFPKR